MKNSKKEVESAILFFADKIKQKENFEAIMSQSSLPKLVEMIVYQLFLHGFNPVSCPDAEYNEYKIIFDYAKELEKNGFVEFQK